MKRFRYVFLLVLVVMALALSSCKVKEDELPADPGPDVEKVMPQKYEYEIIPAKCDFDRDSGEMVCLLAGTKDQRFMELMINEEAAKGWELDTVVGNETRAFIFRREK